MLARGAKFYDRNFAQQTDLRRYGPYARHKRRILLDMLSHLSFSTVLDAGCGQGLLLADLCRAYSHIQAHGVDISPTGLDIARQNAPNAFIEPADLMALPRSRRYDLVISDDVLEHIADDRTALHNLAAVTGRYLLVGTVQGRMRPIEPEAFGHVRNYRYGEIVSMIEAEGLSILRVTEWGWPFYSPLFRDVASFVKARGTSGAYGPGRRLIATCLYLLYNLNSHQKGDAIFVLAQTNQPQDL